MNEIEKRIDDLYKPNTGFVYDCSYNEGLADALSIFNECVCIVKKEYKSLVMGALYEAYTHNLLGSIGDREAASLYQRLKYEDYCKECGKDYDDLTEDDFEQFALREIDEREEDYE